MMLQVIFDRHFEVGNAVKDAASDGIPGDQAEKALDEVDPGRRGRREVEMEAWVAFEPCLDLGMLVGGVVVHHGMQIEGFRCLGIDGAQKAQELLMAVAIHALANDLAGGDVERGEQGRRTMALVIMRYGAGAALLHWQPRLRAVEGLDLAFLIDAQHQCPVGRVEIKPNDVLNFFSELRIIRQLEGLRQVRLSPCAAQMRCTLVWLRPTARASLRADQCVLAGGFS